MAESLIEYWTHRLHVPHQVTPILKNKLAATKKFTDDVCTTLGSRFPGSIGNTIRHGATARKMASIVDLTFRYRYSSVFSNHCTTAYRNSVGTNLINKIASGLHSHLDLPF
jgi:hypothetical protein